MDFNPTEPGPFASRVKASDRRPMRDPGNQAEFAAVECRRAAGTERKRRMARSIIGRRPKGMEYAAESYAARRHGWQQWHARVAEARYAAWMTVDWGCARSRPV
jgi:hypothetical protein